MHAHLSTKLSPSTFEGQLLASEETAHIPSVLERIASSRHIRKSSWVSSDMQGQMYSCHPRSLSVLDSTFA